jgi:hypothetical protein
MDQSLRSSRGGSAFGLATAREFFFTIGDASMVTRKNDDIPAHQSGAENSAGWKHRVRVAVERRGFNRIFTSLSILLSWTVVIAAGVGICSGRLSFRGCEKSIAERERETARALRRDVQRYSARYIDAVRRAAHTDRDFLKSYEAFLEVWNEVSPTEPMMIQMISPGSRDAASMELVPAVNRPPVALTASNFGENQLILRDIRRLILEGDGTGIGLLGATHFAAEPALSWLPATPLRRGAW